MTPRIIRPDREKAKENVVSGSYDYLLGVSSYLIKNVLPRQRVYLPVYFELVTYQGEPISIPYGNSEQILGVRLMVNPSNINTSMNKIINRSTTLTAWVEEHWGEEIDGVSITGNTASFVTSGLGESRRSSVSYQEFRRLLNLYSSNGCVYDEFGIVKERNYVLMTYDYQKLRGYIESIDVTEEAEKPFRFSYSIVFKVESTVYSMKVR